MTRLSTAFDNVPFIPFDKPASGPALPGLVASSAPVDASQRKVEEISQKVLHLVRQIDQCGGVPSAALVERLKDVQREISNALIAGCMEAITSKNSGGPLIANLTSLQAFLATKVPVPPAADEPRQAA